MTAVMEKDPVVPQDCILDKIERHIDMYLDAGQAHRDVMVLFAAATYAVRVCATFPRLLFVSDEEQSGKTLSMDITGNLSSNPQDADGTSGDFLAILEEAANSADKLIPTLKYDELSMLLGRDGQRGTGNNPVARVMRRGYKRGAKLGKWRNGVSEKYSIFGPFIGTGLRTCVPKDIRSRCVVVHCYQGIARQNYDVRDAEQDTLKWGRSLRKEVTDHMKEIAEFRVTRLGIPELASRKGEVWEVLLGVGLALGGARWLNRGIAAFRELALTQLQAPELDPGQELLQMAAELAPGMAVNGAVRSNQLADEMRRSPRYDGRSLAAMAALLSKQMPVIVHQRRMRGFDIPQKCYYLTDILAAWEQVKPVPPEDMEPPEEENPFDVIDYDEEIVEDADADADADALVASVPSVATFAGTQPAPQAGAADAVAGPAGIARPGAAGTVPWVQADSDAAGQGAGEL